MKKWVLPLLGFSVLFGLICCAYRYIYFAADNGSNENHRLFAMQNASKDPFRGD